MINQEISKRKCLLIDIMETKRLYWCELMRHKPYAAGNMEISNYHGMKKLVMEDRSLEGGNWHDKGKWKLIYKRSLRV